MSETAELLWSRVRFHVALCEVEAEDAAGRGAAPLLAAVDRARMLVGGLYWSCVVTPADRPLLLAAARRVAPRVVAAWAWYRPETFPGAAA